MGAVYQSLPWCCFHFGGSITFTLLGYLNHLVFSCILDGFTFSFCVLLCFFDSCSWYSSLPAHSADVCAFCIFVYASGSNAHNCGCDHWSMSALTRIQQEMMEKEWIWLRRPPSSIHLTYKMLRWWFLLCKLACKWGGKRSYGCCKTDSQHCTLPAFDINGEPIRPSQYERLLNGAIVNVHFALMSWVIPGKNPKAMNIPVIWKILVFVPPRPPVMSPMKKKNDRDGLSTSPKAFLTYCQMMGCVSYFVV
jgi:hypothetical protein